MAPIRPDAKLSLVDKAPDPANPGQILWLFRSPNRVLGRRMRILLCTYDTRGVDGSRSRHGLTVPIDCATATAAAAWTFNVSEHDYRALARAT